MFEALDLQIGDAKPATVHLHTYEAACYPTNVGCPYTANYPCTVGHTTNTMYC